MKTEGFKGHIGTSSPRHSAEAKRVKVVITVYTPAGLERYTDSEQMNEIRSIDGYRILDERGMPKIALDLAAGHRMIYTGIPYSVSHQEEEKP